MKKMLETYYDILITNDDGIHAPGLAALKTALEPLGRVLVVAPDSERSAMGHAITILNPLRAFEIRRNEELFGLAVNGTPADCVKLAVHNLLPRPPKLVVSGINLGPNLGTNVLYSGTVSAATEGRILGIPSLAVSLRSFDAQSDFAPAGDYARQIAQLIMTHGLPDGILLNLNVPVIPQAKIKGIRLTRLAKYRYRDWYDHRQDPRGRDYFWLTGKDAEVLNPSPDTDDNAVEEGYVSLTPLCYDLSCLDFIPALRQWFDQ
jgi:5'-nucleotidase